MFSRARNYAGMSLRFALNARIGPILIVLAADHRQGPPRDAQRATGEPSTHTLVSWKSPVMWQRSARAPTARVPRSSSPRTRAGVLVTAENVSEAYGDTS